MEIPISEDEGPLMEWAPYTNLINQIPLKIQFGLFAQDLNLTCVDACNEYIALGTNTGLVFWYGRQKGDLQRLRCEASSSPITFVRIVSTVDFMVAAGNKNGQVTVFQIPKIHPDSIPESLKPKIARQVERYTVGDLHHSEITYIEWSKNGMRLFSGDKNGLVIMTEIDFYMHLCKSLEIINETHEIVQISYYQNYLLVSTVYRSIICHKNESKWDVNQVGKRDRKSFCKLGGIFHFNYEKPNDVNIYCARPGLRVWTSDRRGNVQQTLLFKDAIANPTSHVELLNPALKKSVKSNKDINFGPVFIFKDKYLVSYNEEQLYIVNPVTLMAIAAVDNVRRILSVAVNKGEIFILEGERSLIRISHDPDCQLDKPEENLMSKSLTNPLQLAVNTIKELTSTEAQIHFSDMTDQCDNLLGALKETSVHEMSNITKAEECFELPVVKELPQDINTNLLDKLVSNFIGGKDGIIDDNGENMEQVSNENKINEMVSKKNLTQDFKNEKIYEGEVLHKSKKSKRNNIINLNTENIYSNETLKSYNTSRDSSNEKRMANQKVETKSYNQYPISNVPVGKSILSGDLSPESIEKEIQDKEEILAKILNLEPITISNPKPPSPEILYLNNSEQFSSLPIIKNPEEPKNMPLLAKKSTVSNKNDSKLKNNPPQVFPLSPPKCVSIPNMWNLKEIKIETRTANASASRKASNTKRNTDNSDDLDDWELI